MKIEDYTPDELAEIFKEELDRLGIPYHYDLDEEARFDPLMPDEPVPRYLNYWTNTVLL